MRECSVENCKKKHFSKGYCAMHYEQIRKFGKIRERTIQTLNEIIIENNICIMKLYNQKSEVIAETIFDKENYEKVKLYKWGLRKAHKQGYPNYVYTVNKISGENIYLHHFIMNSNQQEIMIDHIDSDGLNNCKNNLRFCSNSENHMNKTKNFKGNQSGFKGVVFHPKTGKWQAQTHINGKQTYLGIYNTPEEAAKAYNIAVKEHYGEFAKLNEFEDLKYLKE